MSDEMRIDVAKVTANPPPVIAIEIYKQKYENFRHFDKLRWGAVPLTFAAAGLFSISRDAQGNPTWWVLIVFGVFALITAWSMRRVNLGIEMNRRVLQEVATMLGDNSVPPAPLRFGASTLFYGTLFAMGLLAILVGIAHAPRP